MARIVVSGAIANKLHQGGETWVRLSYLLGLRRLGHQVHFLEQIAPETCIDETGSPTSFESSANRTYFDQVLAEFGFSDQATLVPTNATIPSELLALADSADVLLNISGHLSVEPLLRRFRKKVYIDIDPGFTQFWHADGNPGARLDGHDYFFTIAENIGQPTCLVPTVGIPWRTTRPPVVLSEWPFVPATEPLRFTTIANWRGSFGPVEFGGQRYGLKVHEFRKLIELPSRAPSGSFEIALNIHPDDHRDLAALHSNGWRIADPLAASSTPDRFRRYVQESGAEFSVAQGIYVQTGSGWFSDRTTRYLASGRPVLVQDTGFSRHIPTGQGLLAFRTLDEAVRGANAIAADYAAHCQAAREIAERYFDSDNVLMKLLDEVGVTR